jgi:hypothetical protein
MVVLPNRVRVVMVVSALALAAGLLVLALQAKPAQAQAETGTSPQRFSFAGTLTNPCTGETFFVEGTQLFLFHSTLDANGGEHLVVNSNVQAQGVSDSGVKYFFKETNPFHIKTALDSANTFTGMATGRFIRHGSATPEDDFLIRFLSHVTINANGELTSEFDTMEIECT